MTQVIQSARRFLPRFSLATLLCLVLLSASVIGLKHCPEPWIPKFTIQEQEIQGRSNDINDAKFSPRGDCFLTSSVEHVTLWDGESGALIRTLHVPEERYPPAMFRAYFSPDGHYVIGIDSDRRTHIWDAVSGDLKSTLPYGTQRKIIVHGDQTMTLGEVSVSQEEELIEPAKLYFDPSAQYVISDDSDGHCRRWSLPDGKLLWQSMEGEFDRQGVKNVRFTEAGPEYYVAQSSGREGENWSVSVWREGERKPLREFNAHKESISVVQVDELGQRVLTGGFFSRPLYAWQTTPPQLLATRTELSNFGWDIPQDARVFSPDGHHFLVLHDVKSGDEVEMVVEVLDFESLETKVQCSHRSDESVNWATFFPKGDRILGYTHNFQVDIWDAETGANLKAVQVKYKWTFHGDNPFFVGISPDGDRFFCTDGGESLCMYQRTRPEWWWGIAWLPEFWLTLAFSLLLLLSLWRDWRHLKGRVIGTA